MKSEDISQETVRSYLIGNLDEATVDSLDELSIADQGFADRVAAEQYELVDDWVGGRLDPSERAAFGTVLARSPTLVEKVQIAQLMTAVPRTVVVERNASPGFFAAFFGGLARPAYVFGGLAILIGIAAAAWLLMREDKVTELAAVSPTASVSPSSTTVEVPPATPATSNANADDVPPQNTTVQNRPKPSPEATRRSTSLFATLVLTPPTRGASGIKSITLNPGVEFLQLTIQTEADPSGRFIVEVGEPSGNPDWRSQPIRGRSTNGRTTISVRIRAARLKNGMRAVRLLDAAAGSEILDEHIVEIKR